MFMILVGLHAPLRTDLVEPAAGGIVDVRARVGALEGAGSGRWSGRREWDGGKRRQAVARPGTERVGQRDTRGPPSWESLGRRPGLLAARALCPPVRCCGPGSGVLRTIQIQRRDTTQEDSDTRPSLATSIRCACSTQRRPHNNTSPSSSRSQPTPSIPVMRMASIFIIQ